MRMTSSLFFFAVLLASAVSAQPQFAETRPNILWIIVDDMSAHFSCYGETSITTPHVDSLAERGTKFARAFVTAPVCSTCRSAFITGMYQTSIGAHHHRSGRGEVKVHLPEGVVPVPALFQQAGYHTSIGGWPGSGKRGKTDYNFEWDEAMYDSTDWANRKDGQPFFHQVHTPGGKLRGSSPEGNEKISARVEEKLGSRMSVERVTLPPYYPRDPVILRDWAAYLDSVRETDRVVGEVLERLAKEGLIENTVVLFMTDHGISHARGKQFLYDEGIHVPLVIAGPGVEAGKVREDLVEHIDIGALSLGLAGIEIPGVMQGRDVLAADYKPREAVFAARDRCDETVDHVRAVRTQRYKYVRNFLPQRPHLQPCAYKDAKEIYVALRAAHAGGRLDEVQSLLFAPERAPEELYDLEVDPHEIHNLASEPAFAEKLAELRGRLDVWMEETGDLGRDPEPADLYDSDMAVYLDTIKKKAPDRAAIIQANIDLHKKWSSEGK